MRDDAVDDRDRRSSVRAGLGGMTSFATVVGMRFVSSPILDAKAL
jgi:hypothetical protein